VSRLCSQRAQQLLISLTARREDAALGLAAPAEAHAAAVPHCCRQPRLAPVLRCAEQSCIADAHWRQQSLWVGAAHGKAAVDLCEPVEAAAYAASPQSLQARRVAPQRCAAMQSCPAIWASAASSAASSVCALLCASQALAGRQLQPVSSGKTAMPAPQQRRQPAADALWAHRARAGLPKGEAGCSKVTGD
jgi:hypothetical protein